MSSENNFKKHIVHVIGTCQKPLQRTVVSVVSNNGYMVIMIFHSSNFSQFCWNSVVWHVQIEVIHGLAIVKKAAAIVNKEFGLDAKLAGAIVKAADEVKLLLFLLESELCSVKLLCADLNLWC